MKTYNYKGEELVIPRFNTRHTDTRQLIYCDGSDCERVDNCEDCLYDPSNLEAFKEWYNKTQEKI